MKVLKLNKKEYEMLLDAVGHYYDYIDKLLEEHDDIHALIVKYEPLRDKIEKLQNKLCAL